MDTTKPKKILLVFYSFEGNTRLVANILAENLQAKILELKPLKDVPPKGLSKHLWFGKQIIAKGKPDLKPYDKNPAEFDLIIIGTPVWAFTYTPAIRSFLAAHGLKNKDIALFCTHNGAPGKCLLHMREELAGNNIIGEEDFRRVKSTAKAELEKRCLDWVNQLQ